MTYPRVRVFIIITLEHETETHGTSEARGILKKNSTISNFFIASLECCFRGDFKIVQSISDGYNCYWSDEGIIAPTNITLRSFIDNPVQLMRGLIKAGWWSESGCGNM
jgi:hypothetical protein